MGHRLILGNIVRVTVLIDPVRLHGVALRAEIALGQLIGQGLVLVVLVPGQEYAVGDAQGYAVGKL